MKFCDYHVRDMGHAYGTTYGRKGSAFVLPNTVPYFAFHLVFSVIAVDSFTS
jgi:hypothetical protein